MLVLASAGIHADATAGNHCKPVISADAGKDVIFIRPHENAFLVCTLTRDQLFDLISGFLKNPDHQRADYKTIYIGRLLEHRWLSKYLATHALAHGNWNKDKGQPRSGYINQLVRDILSTPEIISQLQKPFQGSGYAVTGVSVEKVLVTKANEIDWLGIDDSALVPYDALTHFRLKKSAPE